MSAVSKVIGTHSGHFHCDEALAVWMLKQTTEFKNASLVRTRDPAKLNECSVVVDVGGVYDPAQHRYDHHQRGFVETFDDKHKTKLSSAGLVYKHFGREVISNLVGDSKQLEIIYQKTYDDFIESLDAHDNGISAYAGATPLFKESPTSLASRVGQKNPAWNEPVPDDQIDARFVEASDLAGSELRGFIERLVSTWLPARDLVVEAIESRLNVHASGQVIALEKSCPWKEHLLDLEKERGLEKVLYVLYPESAPDGNWRIQCVPVRPEGFENRKSLPEQWRGYRDQELSQISGIDGCIFVHAGGFIGGNKSRHGVYEMARLAVEQQ
ncbi:metal-dependent protein hydrolase [Hesseltinella vesiculosa]|uniref:Metal-dependent protein hydrolase n=1 Tax=Hesseltinella vesiculosa TaxID=101127 RepID=A0A1X2GN24_9FUNG|nr:metal-dependent protein hydrolase [Hesseltinella vesiculosa]